MWASAMDGQPVTKRGHTPPPVEGHEDAAAAAATHPPQHARAQRAPGGRQALSRPCLCEPAEWHKTGHKHTLRNDPSDVPPPRPSQRLIIPPPTSTPSHLLLSLPRPPHTYWHVHARSGQAVPPRAATHRPQRPPHVLKRGRHGERAAGICHSPPPPPRWRSPAVARPPHNVAARRCHHRPPPLPRLAWRKGPRREFRPGERVALVAAPPAILHQRPRPTGVPPGGGPAGGVARAGGAGAAPKGRQLPPEEPRAAWRRHARPHRVPHEGSQKKKERGGGEGRNREGKGGAVDGEEREGRGGEARDEVGVGWGTGDGKGGGRRGERQQRRYQGRKQGDGGGGGAWNAEWSK